MIVLIWYLLGGGFAAAVGVGLQDLAVSVAVGVAFDCSDGQWLFRDTMYSVGVQLLVTLGSGQLLVCSVG